MFIDFGYNCSFPAIDFAYWFNGIILFNLGAAKYRKLLQRLRPRITIVEEAAEVLESHIVTSLTPGCQHLILIGDHQQLRPNPTVYELAKHYNLDISLFERMVTNGMPFERLRLQHRMRPEISKMLEHIYKNPKLENHESVMNFDKIKGVARNMFFVDHAESEVGSKEYASDMKGYRTSLVIGVLQTCLAKQWLAFRIRTKIPMPTINELKCTTMH